MALGERLTDAQIASELAEFGEIIELPIKRNKRPVLLKKLNHLRVRRNSQKSAPASYSKSNQSVETASTRNLPARQTDHEENAPRSRNASLHSRDSRTGFLSGISDSRDRRYRLESFDSNDLQAASTSTYPQSYAKDYRSERGRTTTRKDPTSHGQGLIDTFVSYFTNSSSKKQEHEAAAPSRTADFGSYRSTFSTATGSIDDDENPPFPGSSRLYPDLSRYKSSSSHLLPDYNARFESSDSDIDERMNRSLPPSFQDTRHGQKDTSSPSSYLSSLYRNRRQDDPGKSQILKPVLHAHMSRLLIVIAVLIFVGLAVTYIIMHLDIFLPLNSGSGDVLLVCNNVTQKDCYTKEVVEQALQYLGKLFESLSVKKGRVICGEASPGEDKITVTDLQSHLYKELPQNTNVESLLECIVNHILVNPHWKIRALQDNGTVAKSKDEVIKLESEVASMNVWCRLRRSVYKVFYELCLTATAIAAFVVLLMYLNYRQKRKEREQKEVFSMVNKIIEILQDHYEETKEDDSDVPEYLAVQHVRDQLLPPATRQKMQPIWDKAVAFIAANESRVQVQTRLIQGDEFEVWRWLQPVVPKTRSKQSSVRTGSASVERDSLVSLRPTPCLRICNVFNSDMQVDDDWEDRAINTVLKKCSDEDSIVHVCIDEDVQEGCVFMKCSDLEAAVSAKDELHGWRLKGQVVTVQYIKTDQYDQLFPDARHAKKPRW